MVFFFSLTLLPSLLTSIPPITLALGEEPMSRESTSYGKGGRPSLQLIVR